MKKFAAFGNKGDGKGHVRLFKKNYDSQAEAKRAMSRVKNISKPLVISVEEV